MIIGPETGAIESPRVILGRMSAAHLLAVALGGAIGAGLRYLLYHLFHSGSGVAPHWTIAAVNLIGCIAIGVLLGWLDGRGITDERIRIFVGWGILGAFTTFSTFAMDGLQLIRDARYTEAIAYLAGSVILGVLLVWLGYRVTHGLVATQGP